MEISKLQYSETLEKAAIDAANERVKQYNQIYKELSYDSVDEMTKKYYLDFLQKLKTAYPYDKVTLDDLSAIKNYSSDKMQEYLYQFNAPNRQALSPTEHVKAIKAADIFPLLQGVAKDGRDWTSMDNMDLKKFGYEHGYDVKSKEGYAKLLKDIGEQQVNYDRAQMLKEGQQGADYWLSKLMFPSYTQEIENAVLTGQGGDDSTLRNLKAIDVLANTAQAVAPSVNISKMNPLLMGTIDAIAGQGGAELVRQYAKEAASKTGQEADIGDVLLAASLGATRPGMATMAAGAVNQFPGKIAKDVARGFQKGARTGSGDERVAIEKAVNLYNKDLAPIKNGFRIDWTGNKYDDAVKVPQMAKLFGVTPDANGKYSAKQILSYYDSNTKAPKFAQRNESGLTNDLFENSVLPEPTDFERTKLQQALGLRNPEMMLGKDKIDQYKALFPEKAGELDANRTAFILGQLGGNVIANAGGRIEPIVKSNPLKLTNDNGMQKSYKERYKDQSWYKSLDEESKKILDEVLKGK